MQEKQLLLMHYPLSLQREINPSNGGHQYGMENLIEANQSFDITAFKVNKDYFIPLINKFNNKESQ